MDIRLVDIGGMFEHHCLHNDINQLSFHIYCGSKNFMRIICLVAIPDDFQGLFYYRQEMSHLFCLMINGADSQDVWNPMIFSVNPALCCCVYLNSRE